MQAVIIEDKITTAAIDTSGQSRTYTPGPQQRTLVILVDDEAARAIHDYVNKGIKRADSATKMSRIMDICNDIQLSDSHPDLVSYSVIRQIEDIIDEEQ